MEENNISEKDEKIKKRDSSIDLIRIFACLTVVGIHVSLNVFNEYYSEVDWSRLFEKCFLTDGVPLFFMITGFFLLNGRSYKKIWKSTIVKILIPTFFYVWIAQMFFMFITNKQPFSWCMEHAVTNMNWGGILRTTLTGDLKHINSLCAHLWYIFSYVKIIIFVPILWLLFKEEKIPVLARRIILGFGICSMILEDVQRFVTFPQGHLYLFNLVDREIIYVILGYEMFKYKDKIKNNKKVLVSSIVGFVLINVLRYKLENCYMVMNNYYEIIGRDTFAEWKYSSLNVFSGICAFMALYSIPINNLNLKKVLYWLSDKTFGIYLIHYMLIAKVDLYKFDKIGTLPKEILYLVSSLIITFMASAILVCLIRGIKEIILKLFGIIYKKIKRENELKDNA